jgi:hypothetical protein
MDVNNRSELHQIAGLLIYDVRHLIWNPANNVPL